MRIFTKLRCILMSDETLAVKIEKLECDSKEMKKVFRIVFEKLNQLEDGAHIFPKDRNRIGLK